jgi:hypothetical protein
MTLQVQSPILPKKKKKRTKQKEKKEDILRRIP